MLDALRDEVLRANVALATSGLARFTFGNASAIDRAAGRVVIKPSGVPYSELTRESMVVTDLDGRVVEGALRPSSDLATHLVLYRAFVEIGGIVHTHSHFATAWAQAEREIPCLGTTHADYFHGSIPVTAPMPPHQITGEYEANTGAAIVDRFGNLDSATMPAVLVAGHAPFCWGASVSAAVHIAELLEEVATMAYHTVVINAEADEISAVLRDRHFFRKHGNAAYYGQHPG
ncbi:MAG TPA: L-ribulose-5-phosphate 4-epimerase AraD [Gemmatimonadales bacterium]|jgi:L-ribulose-5-phosphate 4-epimerase